MKLQQLEYVIEIVKQGFHISAAANNLYTSQPSISRQLQQLEEELGFPVFERSRNHIEGLTPMGEIVLDIAMRIMSGVEDLSTLKDVLMSSDHGTLTIATTHTVANYILPDVISAFIKEYPGVEVVLIQEDPEGICALVDERKADLAIGTDAQKEFPRLVEIPYRTLDRVIVVPEHHPLLEKSPVTLADVAAYPIITYDRHFSGYWKVRAAFDKADLHLKVALSAIDAGVCKTYVSAGLGIAILTDVTVDPVQDHGLRTIPANHLVPSSTVSLKIRQNTYLRPFLLDFIGKLSPMLTPELVTSRVQIARRPANLR